MARHRIGIILTPDMIAACLAVLAGLGMVLLGSIVMQAMGLLLVVVGVLMTAFSAIRVSQFMVFEMNQTIQQQNATITQLRDRLDKVAAERDDARDVLRDMREQRGTMP